ncbi:uncharacterized protein ColSpa_11225 [Colletotrichum spaethianum]|uniref:Uncharacterized protein n=1 Tax=Colletotrichum spaethianum TaxID=700344 RepID=A0AA37UKB6_9PEZI|nr:uncharacterized protein ColSpa_11225 [Colletotrichum spaethianum]GKT51044.1 hypothetical protein ColSpa_11225 [Colletotrichum spaethianum]
MTASQSQRTWELEDQPMAPKLDQQQRDMPDDGSKQHDSSNVRWPFEDVDDDKQPLPPHQPSGGSSFQCQPPMDPALRPSQGRIRYILRYWSLEIFTVFVAFCLLAAIITLLAYYNGHYMPEWPFEINLNTAIALLSTLLRAAIVAAVAEIIGQIKWTWFAEKTRPLQHLQDFDAASRSVLGSIRLLGVVVWNLGFSSAGLLAIGSAIITIASLTVGPVTQQAVRTETCSMIQEHARSAIPVANYVPGSSSYYRVGAGLYELEVDMKSAMIKGITDPASQDSNVQVTCSSGNCTWPDWGTGVTHASIGICSSCIDTTSFVSSPQLGDNLTLPDNGAFINVLGGNYMWMGYSNLSAYTELFSDDFAQAAAVSLANFSMLMVTKSPCTSEESNGITKLNCPHRLSQSDNSYFDGIGDYIASSCVLYPCMKEYSARYEDNVLTEKLVRTTTAVLNSAEQMASGTTYRYSASGNYTAIQSPCVLDDGTWYDTGNQSEALHVPGRTWANVSLGDSDVQSGDKISSVPNACLYKMDGIFFEALSNFLNGDLLSASCTYNSMQSGHINCYDSWWLTPLWADMNATVSSLTEAIDNFTWAVTNKFRMTGLGPDVLRGTDALSSRGAEALGEVWTSTTCTFFDQKYIALPIILVVICAFLLGWIIFKNYSDPEQPVWKGSVLPLLFFGLHNTVGPREPGVGACTSGSRGCGDSRRDERLARNMTLFREDGRGAPELDRIHQESARTWVRFHGGTDPGFLDLGTKKKRNDPEADNVGLMPPAPIKQRLYGSKSAR